MDWVPAHFPKDDWALARFDGTALYEHADPRLGEHPDWGTLVFNYGRNEVRNFLIANALYWLDEFHIDGLRVDAVASMLYLDYSREPGEWVPNEHGGRENLDAIEFIRELNTVVFAEHPGVMTIAEESTSWPKVSRPVDHGGLGFSHKWNMGWMHDTLGYFQPRSRPPPFHHRDLTFGLLYAFTENFVLPLSHDEVVHGKGSLLDEDAGRRVAALRQPAGPVRLDVGLSGRAAAVHGRRDRPVDGVERGARRRLAGPRRRDAPRRAGAGAGPQPGVGRHRGRCGSATTSRPASSGSTPTTPRTACTAFLRWSADGRQVVACLANFTPVPRDGYRVGLPWGGEWRVLRRHQRAVLRRHRLRRHARRVGRRRRAAPGPAGLGVPHAAAARHHLAGERHGELMPRLGARAPRLRPSLHGGDAR